MNRSLILLPLLLLAASLAGCKPENKFQPPPPPEIKVAVPLAQNVVPYEELTATPWPSPPSTWWPVSKAS